MKKYTYQILVIRSKNPSRPRREVFFFCRFHDLLNQLLPPLLKNITFEWAQLYHHLCFALFCSSAVYVCPALASLWILGRGRVQLKNLVVLTNKIGGWWRGSSQLLFFFLIFKLGSGQLLTILGFFNRGPANYLLFWDFV